MPKSVSVSSHSLSSNPDVRLKSQQVSPQINVFNSNNTLFGMVEMLQGQQQSSLSPKFPAVIVEENSNSYNNLSSNRCEPKQADKFLNIKQNEVRINTKVVQKDFSFRPKNVKKITVENIDLVNIEVNNDSAETVLTNSKEIHHSETKCCAHGKKSGESKPIIINGKIQSIRHNDYLTPRESISQFSSVDLSLESLKKQ